MIHLVKSLDSIPKIQKGWGWEYLIENCVDYCGKELVLYKDKKCSVHYHKVKKETFYVVSGKMYVDVYDRPFEVEGENFGSATWKLIEEGELVMNCFFMTVGDSLLIEPGTPHRFTGIADETRFIEFSTQHFEEDSYRIWPGDSQNG